LPAVAGVYGIVHEDTPAVAVAASVQVPPADSVAVPAGVTTFAALVSVTVTVHVVVLP
jgi:hypothetical protein